MRWGAAGLTLAVALGFAGLASAQESGNWFTRMLTPAAEKIEPVKKSEIKPVVSDLPAALGSNRAAQAKTDLVRRQEVCLRLREIAIANGDDDLLRKAEMLDQRAYDLYLASRSQSRPVEQTVVVPGAKKGGR